MRAWVAQLRKGLIEFCVMGVLADDEAYGYEILQRLGAIEALAVTESTVYPILARLAREALVSVRTAPSPAGPPRRYYRLTPAGRQRLREMAEYWKALTAAVDDLAAGDSRRRGAKRS